MRKAWTYKEMYYIHMVVRDINNYGRSIYSICKGLKAGPLKYRSWESIRSKINETRRRAA